ncbi:MAG: hypothetical protein WBH57_01990 [Anaerolineae bacterium]
MKKYRIYAGGKDTRLVVTAESPREAVEKARSKFAPYMLGSGPLKAVLFRDEEGRVTLPRPPAEL